MLRIPTIVRVTMLAGLGLGGCADDTPVTQGDARIADDELIAGVTVTLDGALGRVELPFELPVPAVAQDRFEDEMQTAVSLFIASEISGAAADLAAGRLVDGTPARSGEFTWALNDDRDRATLTFFNESPGGLTLTEGRPYRAQLAVTRNAYVESLPTISFPVAVTGG